MTNTPQTATVSDEAVQAAFEAYGDRYRSIAAMQDALTAALPHLVLSAAPCSVEVEKLRWHNVDAYCAWCYADTEVGQYRVTWSLNETGQKLHFPDGTTKQFNEKGYGDRDAAKAAAQADFDRRILSQIVTKPVDVAAVQEQCAKLVDDQADKINLTSMDRERSITKYLAAQKVALRDAAHSIRALSPAEPVEQWSDFSNPPKNGRFIAASSGEIERADWRDLGAVITIKAPEEPFACFIGDDGKTFMDEFGELYSNDGRVIDAEDLTAEDNVLRLTRWHPFPAAPTSKGGA